MKKKQCSLLLELLVALGLVMLCLFPLLKPHFAAEKMLVKQGEEAQLARLSKIVAADVKTKLYKHDYPWKKLKGGVKDILPTPIEIYLPGSENKIEYQVEFDLKKIRHYTRKMDEAHFLLMELAIFFRRGNTIFGPFVSHLFLEEKKS